jgi:hypothetical protein
MLQKLSTADDDKRLAQWGIQAQIARHRFGLIMIAKIVYSQLAAATRLSVTPADCEDDLADALATSAPLAAIVTHAGVPASEHKDMAKSIARHLLDDPGEWSNIIT